MTFQLKAERDYHIFYQILSNKKPELLGQYRAIVTFCVPSAGWPLNKKKADVFVVVCCSSVSSLSVSTRDDVDHK